jgi:hypothetical protein
VTPWCNSLPRHHFWPAQIFYPAEVFVSAESLSKQLEDRDDDVFKDAAREHPMQHQDISGVGQNPSIIGDVSLEFRERI